ncbi:MAG: hypothetical protein UR25_C0001G0049 [Candidatus Nomurabacteria bacterium GW2011_GWE1_32_28]|uniref:D-alanine-D-alanine ligase n=1 Tax=Candidatus Nomurabacteria bacterium GW2011_GWF1_31_48 TaxID=1618767 RepID=A0A0F9YGV4_9BACT|nr:MAG: hypothetical protein UR10_C0001G0002 [Candidatus Nomurabacteria bacterium GW2011_GWF2_30_133]KKP28880.1 MAG: hypothetical protein UR18_C0001G0001 [Candidatus Nomurabacteria bacterium GW2011_GWE2_31_40]KKP30618.1 MAG: hypothetical protein UR19_C0001G0002 [Candidatus Nomurabacteria bacterium GW2011_GWF1_31_48]KKP35136.1 MAG: hypothetical protein UR25_C0001G0049 [Candidatus Nomurabacteria bacterium GW2011_GWE1_32_28]HAS80446.1 hypothetical protein [Candidatus Nomurabacteria bacterium]
MIEKKERNKIRVGVLRGGISKDYRSSLLKGGDIISNIFENLSEKYKVVDILVDKDDVWHLNGLPIKPSDLMYKIDVVWNTSHSNYSKILKDLSIPNIGVGHFLKILESKEILENHVKNIEVKIPRSIVFSTYQKDFDGPIEKYAIKKAKEVMNKFPAPWIVKSFTLDSNTSIHLAKTFGELVDVVKDGVAHDKSILVEEFILGKVSSVHSISGFRGEDIYVLPPINFSVSEKDKIISLAKNLHIHLGVKYYLKSDFILHPKLGFFLTNIDFSPDFRVDSHLKQSCDYVGAEMHHILDYFLEKALKI